MTTVQQSAAFVGMGLYLVYEFAVNSAGCAFV